MSSRLKKRKARWKKRRDKPTRARPGCDRLNTDIEAGSFIGRRPQSGWMTFESYERQAGLPAKDPVQQSSCDQTGEMFIRPIEGRYQNLSDDDLHLIIGKIEGIFERAGVPMHTSSRMPLWMRAEYLENMLDFEMNPPCGCESELAKKIEMASS